MLAKEMMSTDVFWVDEERDFNHVELVAELKNVRHVPVVDSEQKLVGIVSIRDLLAHLTVAGASHFAPIRELMHRSVVSVGPEDAVKDVAARMVERNIGCVPVVDGGKIVGMISERDFVQLAAGDK